MASHTARIADLSKEKQALLLKRIKDRSALVNQTISKRANFSLCPLSFAQERLWFLAQMEPDSPFYNIAGLVQLQGNLNISILEQALNEVVRRHEALRTSFVTIENEVRQAVEVNSAITINHIDLTGMDELQQKSIVKILEVQEAHRVFDLKQPPLLRTTLLKLDGERYVLLMTLHHIVADEWSLRLLIKEIGTYYQTFKSGNPSSEPELMIQYADFADWQRNRLQGELYAKQIAYWRQYLENAPRALELPIDRPRPLVMSYHGASHEFELNDETTAALIRLSRQADTTLFVVMMATFTILLSRYSGQSTICVGYPIANRNRRDIESLIGFFVNTLVLKSDLSGNPTFIELLNNVRKNSLDAQNNQDLPFERLVEELKLEREPNRTPLFQAMLVYQNAPMDTLSVPELKLNIADAEMNSAKFDLTLRISKLEKNIRCTFKYSTELFDESTIYRMTNNLKKLLGSVLDFPDTQISDLPLLTADENRLILEDWNQTRVVLEENKCIFQLFEEQVEKTPNAIAVIFEDRSLTYKELNIRANQVAHYLRSKGVGAEMLVGLCVDRSLEMIIGLLGILKAGGAYVPIDPYFPSKRLELLLNETKVSILLTQEEILSKLTGWKGDAICLDNDSLLYNINWIDNLNANNYNGCLVYVIFTSGSTGKPKGVSITNHGLVNYVFSMIRKLAVKPGLRFAIVSTISADLGNTSIFISLLSGGCLNILSYENVMDSSKFYQSLSDTKIDIIKMVPSHLNALLDGSNKINMPIGDCLVVGGETMSVGLSEKIINGIGCCKLINHYGPTEATIGSLTLDVKEYIDNHTRIHSIPIGRPIDNVYVYVLDKQSLPVPIGVIGELYIGGFGLARGYINRPDLTADKFVPNPFRGDGSRLYRTGDWVRYRPDGNIEFLGRFDDQLKIRGFRIELEEIRMQLLKYHKVVDSVVVAKEDMTGDRRLVGYIVTKEKDDFNIADLMDFMRTELPDYMCPSLYIFLEKLPLTANGKLDREALPAPDFCNHSKIRYIAPLSETEKVLVRIFEEVLKVNKISVEDSFFDLGGHSLLATQLMSKICNYFNISLPLKTIFEAKSVRKIAQEIDLAVWILDNNNKPGTVNNVEYKEIKL
jgi:amino acid adenylation domain-containing protein